MNNMELPAQLKQLYKHWGLHTDTDNVQVSYPNELFLDINLFTEITTFVHERINIWKKKVANEQPPFTADPILSKFKFCNIYREFDKQTIEFHSMLKHLENNFPLWLLNMFYCRMVARTETIKHAGLLSFDNKNNSSVYEKLINSPRPRFGTPYVFPVSVIQEGPDNTRELFITRYLPNIMDRVATEIKTWKRKPVYDGVGSIIPIFGYKLVFHWTEVLIDVAYQFPHFIDLFGKFPIGPGAAPTMLKINPNKDITKLPTDLSRISIDTEITFNGKTLKLSAENWEGIACEYRKYTNLKNGGGRHRLYKRDEKESQNNPLF